LLSAISSFNDEIVVV